MYSCAMYLNCQTLQHGNAGANANAYTHTHLWRACTWTHAQHRHAYIHCTILTTLHYFAHSTTHISTCSTYGSHLACILYIRMLAFFGCKAYPRFTHHSSLRGGLTESWQLQQRWNRMNHARISVLLSSSFTSNHGYPLVIWPGNGEKWPGKSIITTILYRKPWQSIHKWMICPCRLNLPKGITLKNTLKEVPKTRVASSCLILLHYTLAFLHYNHL